MRVSCSENVGDSVYNETVFGLVKLLDEGTEMDLKNNIVVIIGNVAVESASLRDQFILQGAISSLQNVIESCHQLVLLSHASWALGNMCLGDNPPPDFSKCSSCILTLAKLIPHENFQVMINSCFAMAYLIQGNNLHIGSIIVTEVCPRLMKILDASGPRELTIAALFALRKIVCGTDEEIHHVLGCGALKSLKDLLRSIDDKVVSDSCYVIANIAAGKSCDIQAVIDSGAIRELLTLVQSVNQEVKSAAAFALRQSLSVSRTKPEQVEFFVSEGCIEILSQQLPLICSQEAILVAVMRALMTIMNFFTEKDKRERCIKLFLKFGCELLIFFIYRNIF